MIYFIQGGDAIKIGFVGGTRALRNRISNLQTNCPIEVTLLGAMDGDLVMEKALHLKFADYYLQGEWFMAHAEITAFIETNCYFPRLTGRSVVEECRSCGKAPVTSRHARLCEVCRLLCSRCRKNPPANGQRYCNECFATFAREQYHRRPDKRRKLSDVELLASRARAYARTYIKRGKLQIRPCEVEGCQTPPSLYHKDYSKPLDVTFLCRQHAKDLGLYGSSGRARTDLPESHCL